MKKQLPTLLSKRTESLMPNGIPKYVRCYDYGEDSTIDRYTVCFTGTAPVIRSEYGVAEYPYVGMSNNPRGFYQHGWSKGHPCDSVDGRPPAIGRKNHLGKRIPFSELPKDCQYAVLQDYKDFWKLWESNEIHLKQGECLTTTHLVLMEDGTWKNVKDLSSDELLVRNIKII